MKRLLALCLTALLLLGSLPVSILAQEDQGTAISGDYVEGEAIVCLKADTGMLRSYSAGSELLENAEVLMDLGDEGGIATFSAGTSDTLALVQSDTQSTAELITALEALPQVEFAEPNYIYTTSENSTGGVKDLTGYQWGYQTKTGEASYDLSIPSWNTTPVVDTSDTVVAVLDSGIDYLHEDLKDVMWTATPELRAKIGGGEYGYTAPTENSKGEAYDSTDPMDDDSHGTHCAGIIASAWNGKGVSGATSGAKLMAVKASNDLGQFYSSNTIKGYNYIKKAVSNGVKVTAVNNSWGGAARGEAVNRGVTALGELGVVSVFAAGNSTEDCDLYSSTVTTLRDNPYAIVVNATDAQGNMASFSNYGATTTDVAAPGVDILSTIPTSRASFDGRFVDAPFLEGFEGETPTMTFTSALGKSAITTEMSYEGSKSLKITASGEENPRGLVTSGKMNLSATRYGYLSCMYRADSTEAQTLYAKQAILRVKTTEPDTEGKPVWATVGSSMEFGGSWGCVNGKLPGNTDYEDFQIQIGTARILPGGSTLGAGDVYVDNIAMGDTLAAYGYMSGTSMAAPAVTGEVAILAKAFEDDSAAKTAARVVGSVKEIASQSGKSVSEGLAQVSIALAKETVPVVNAAVSMGDNQLAITGYFFGENPTVTIDDALVDVVPSAGAATASVSAIDDEERIVVNLPEGMAAGVKRIKVASDKGSGHQSFEIGAADSLYTRLPLPIKNADSFYDSNGGSLTGLGGSLYYCGSTSKYDLEFWRYTPGQTENNGWTRLAGDASICPATNTACTWEGKLVIVSEGLADTKIAVYDPDTEKWSTFAPSAMADLYSAALVNTGSELLLIGGGITEDGREIAKNSIYRLDITAQTIESIGTLQRARISPAVAYTADGSVYVAAGRDSSGMVDGLEKIENGASSLVRDKVLPTGLADQSYTGSFGTVDGGMLLTGPVVTGENNQVSQDTYRLSFGEGGFTPTDKIVSTSKLLSSQGMAYQGTYYTLAVTANAENHRVFSADNTVKTLAQPGDKTITPVDPENPDHPMADTTGGTDTTVKTGLGNGPLGAPLVAVLLAACAIMVLGYRRYQNH